MAILGKDDRGDAAVTRRKPQPAAKPLRQEAAEPRATRSWGTSLRAAPKRQSDRLESQSWDRALAKQQEERAAAGSSASLFYPREGEKNIEEARTDIASRVRPRLDKLTKDTQFDALSERGRTLRAEAAALSAKARDEDKVDPIEASARATKHALKKIDSNDAAAPKPSNDNDDENVREMTQQDFEKLSPRQRAAVMYNSQLVRTVEKDQAKGESKRTEKFLSDLGVEVGNDIDEFLQLDRAIDNSIISILDSKGARQNSASSLRYARREAEAPQAFGFDRATGFSNRAGEALANNMLARGELSLRGEKGPTSAGYSDDLRDQALRRGYSLMVDADTEQTLDDVKQGLATLNEMNGLDITIDELLDFTRLQLDTVELAQLSDRRVSFTNPTTGKSKPVTGGIRVPVWDDSITPLSVKEIRKRYGL